MYFICNCWLVVIQVYNIVFLKLFMFVIFFIFVLHMLAANNRLLLHSIINRSELLPSGRNNKWSYERLASNNGKQVLSAFNEQTAPLISRSTVGP
jgi:hypothetical protein